MGDESYVTELFNKFFKKLCTNIQEYTFMEYKYYYLHLINAIIISLKTTTPSVSISADITDNQRQQIKLSFQKEELYRCSIETLKIICRRNSDNPIYSKGQSADVTVQNMQKYIERNFSYCISLEYMSDLFFLNKNYVSSLFKAKSGINFTDYLSKVRVEKAKALLKNPNIRISQVAANVGYTNTKYFFRVFKKLTGFTPEEYRNKNTY